MIQNALRYALVGLFIALIVALFVQKDATAWVWTFFIPFLPLALLIFGFSWWRNVCPLATFSQLASAIPIHTKRKVPQWFEHHFWLLQYTLLFIALSARLLSLNSATQLLAYFFLFTIVSAIVINLLFSGKSWCNFFCPVAPIEKIYTLSNAKNFEVNSACSNCSACKKNCPDIDLESNYWKEGSLREKNIVFFSFPGLVFGFYFFYYLHAGSWAYYFDGSWTHAPIELLGSGFFFAPFIPLVIAAPLTLAMCALVSYFLFSSLQIILIERDFFKNLDEKTYNHRIKVFAAFVAFNIFYLFAGAPMYSHYPVFYALFYFGVVFFSAIIFYKEIFRQEEYFIQERFALKMIKKLRASKIRTTNLKEIYYTYINENKNKKDRLKTYENSIVELMQDGILTQDSLKVLDHLRTQIGISAIEHNQVMQMIELKNKDLFDNTIDKSSEKRYQKQGYKQVIENALAQHIDLDHSYLDSLQKQFQISNEEHNAIISEILNSNEQVQNDIFALLKRIHELIILQNSIYESETREIRFLRSSIYNEFKTTSKELFTLLFTLYKEHKSVLKQLLNIAKGKADPDFVMDRHSIGFIEDKLAYKMLAIYKDFITAQLDTSEQKNENIIHTLLYHPSLRIAIAALMALKNNTEKYLTPEVLERFCETNDQEIMELVYKIRYNTNTITTYEKMMYINNVPLFHNLKFKHLHALAYAAKVVSFDANEYIIRQGEVGKKLFMLIRGGAVVEIDGTIVSQIGHREYFGEIAIMGNTTRTASIRTTQPTTALSISKKEFKQFLQHNPKVSIKVMKQIIKKLV